MVCRNIDDEQVKALSVFRRDLHQHLELGFFEVRTAAKVTHELNALGIKFTYED